MKRAQTRVEPSRSLLQGAAYTHSSQTDIAARFEALRPKAAAPQRIYEIQWAQHYPPLRRLK